MKPKKKPNARPRADYWDAEYTGAAQRELMILEPEEPLLVDARGNALRRAIGFKAHR